MEKTISCCGLVCSDCSSYGKECAGCRAVAGAPYWVSQVRMEVCPVYACADAKGFADCGQCGDLPCALFLELREPGLPDDVHEANIKARVGELRGRNA